MFSLPLLIVKINLIVLLVVRFLHKQYCLIFLTFSMYCELNFKYVLLQREMDVAVKQKNLGEPIGDTLLGKTVGSLHLF